jgi:prepilin-type N-terminal cleavage/methylation domain-containing protein|nr:prepilin-type N-terminal cleavage/methylation domain-containing protein [uncultured Limnohabitans sp.]
MQTLGFSVFRASNSHGFTLVELLVCLCLLGVLAAFAAPNWLRFQERARVEATRDQLMNDLQNARLRALQLGQALELSRLSDCTWVTSASTDWSCGWQLTTKADKQVVFTTPLHNSLGLTFAKVDPLDISPRGDLGTVGDRWVIKSKQPALNLAVAVCLNSASRIRWVSGEACS